jgi:hypothetical protein
MHGASILLLSLKPKNARKNVLSTECAAPFLFCGFFSSILWPPLTISERKLEMRAEMHLGRYLKCPLFFPIITKI